MQSQHYLLTLVWLFVCACTRTPTIVPLAFTPSPIRGEVPINIVTQTSSPSPPPADTLQPTITPSPTPLLPSTTPTNPEPAPLLALSYAYQIDEGNPGVAPKEAIYTIRADGTEFQRLINEPAISKFPQWSPDGIKMAFLSSEYYPASLYVYDLESGQSRKIVDNTASFSWSADGTALFYSEYLPETPDVMHPIYKVSIAENQRHVIVEKQWLIWRLYLSPQGDRLLANVKDVDGSDALYVLDLEGKVQKLPVQGARGLWHPNGSEVIYQVTYGKCSQIRVINIDGTNDRAFLPSIVSEPDCGSEFSPRLSPDGNLLAFNRLETLALNAPLYIYELDTGRLQQVSSSSENALRAAWSPDSRYLAYLTRLSHQSYSLRVYSVADRSILVLIDSNVAFNRPSWQP